MKNALTFAAVGEAATGLALLIAPSLVVHLLLGEQLTSVAIPVARVTGIAVIALAIACWVRHSSACLSTAHRSRCLLLISVSQVARPAPFCGRLSPFT